MTEETENLVLRLLQELRTQIQELRSEAAERDRHTQAQIGVLSQGQLAIRNEQLAIRNELHGMRDEFKNMSLHIQEIAIAIDHHTTRLDRIEAHLGLDKAQH